MNSASGVTEDRLADTSIDNRRQIALLLGRILQSRSLLSVGAPGKPASSSLLLEVAPLRGYLLIDEPLPALPLPPGSPIAVSGRLDGGHFSFNTRVEAPDMSSRSSGALQLRLPEQLLYCERRGDFRLGLPPRLNLAPSEFVEDGQRFRGRLSDLSRQGAATLVSRELPIGTGASLSCLLHLPHTSLRASAEVCSLSEQLGQLRLGLRLLELSPADDALLSMEINALQRLALRSRR